MKFVLLIAFALVCIWLWRSTRPSAQKRNRRPTADEPQAMVRCALCSVHVPVIDAIQGKNGLYCSAEHRQRAES